MTFPNGLNGVKKVFASEILSLIAGVIAIVAAVLGMAALSTIEEGQLTTGTIDSGALAGAGIAGILAIVTSVLLIIALILKLVGLGKAGKDNGAFKTAFTVAIFALVLTVVTAGLRIFMQNSFVDELVDLISRICSIAVIFLVVSGIQDFAAELGDSKMEAKGNSISWVIAIPYFLGAVAVLAQGIFGNNPESQSFAGILGIAGAILSVIGSILYLVYLGQAKKMLRNN